MVYATPIRKGECRLFARFPFKFSSKLPGLFIKLTPRWYTHVGNNRVLEDDQIFLHIQERMLEQAGAAGAAPQQTRPYAQACYLPTQADRYVIAFRKWVTEFEADPFPGQTLPAEWSTDALLDRYNSHTKHCGSCRPALKRLQQLRQGALVVSAIAWSAIPVVIALAGTLPLALGLPLTVVPLLAGGFWLWSGNLAHKFYRGEAIPPRNVPQR